MKKYKVQLIETYAFDFEVEAENRVEAEEKARTYVDNYTDDDYFACSANSHVKDVFGGGLDIAEQHYCYNCGAIMDGRKEKSR